MSQSQIKALSRRRTANPLLLVGQFLRHAAARRRTRSALAQLDPHLLRDIGLDAARVADECAKPFWRP